MTATPGLSGSVSTRTNSATLFTFSTRRPCHRQCLSLGAGPEQHQGACAVGETVGAQEQRGCGGQEQGVPSAPLAAARAGSRPGTEGARVHGGGEQGSGADGAHEE